MQNMLHTRGILSPPKASNSMYSIGISFSPKISKPTSICSSSGEWALVIVLMLQWALIAAVVFQWATN